METKIAVSKIEEIIRKKQEYLSHQKLDDYFAYENVFNTCLDRLHYEYKKIIIECFVNKKFKFWWMEYYSKSAFYRARSRAVVCFVSLFEMIYENIQIPSH